MSVSGSPIGQRHRFVDGHVGGLRVRVEDGVLQNALHEHVALHLVLAALGVLRRRNGESGIPGCTSRDDERSLKAGMEKHRRGRKELLW